MASHCSVLAWEILWTEEPGRLQSVGLQRVLGYWEGSGTQAIITGFIHFPSFKICDISLLPSSVLPLSLCPCGVYNSPTPLLSWEQSFETARR